MRPVSRALRLRSREKSSSTKSTTPPVETLGRSRGCARPRFHRCAHARQGRARHGCRRRRSSGRSGYRRRGSDEDAKRNESPARMEPSRRLTSRKTIASQRVPSSRRLNNLQADDNGSVTSAPAVCPNCLGTGWKIVEREEISGAVRCACVAVERAAHLESDAGIPPLYANASFENFLLPRDNPIAYRELTRFSSPCAVTPAIPQHQTARPAADGRPGTGKTHLAVAAFRAIIAKGFEGLFFDYQNLLDRIRSGYDRFQFQRQGSLPHRLDAEVLLLDDLGAHRVTDGWKTPSPRSSPPAATSASR